MINFEYEAVRTMPSVRLGIAAFYVVIGGALLLGSMAVAGAADLPLRAAPPVAPSATAVDWTGFYVGFHAGYQFEGAAAPVTNAVTNANLTLAGFGAGPNGFIAGGHGGYNYEGGPLGSFGGPLGSYRSLFGVEGDVDGAHYRGTYSTATISDAFKQQITGSVRGRLGVAVERLLVFATGGVAVGDIDDMYRNVTLGATDVFNHTRIGYTLGGGIEYAMFSNIAFRAEYRYTNWGTFNDTLLNSTGGVLTVRHHEVNNRVLAGLSWRFNSTPVPVVARY